MKMQETKIVVEVKKKTEDVEKISDMKCAIEELSMFVNTKLVDVDHYADDDIHIPTKSFLSICNLFVHVLDKIGPTMAVLRQDIHQNIQRLEKLSEADSSKNTNLIDILKTEVSEGIAKKGNTCSKSIVWLTRSMDFAVALLERLLKEPLQDMEEAVEESYNIAFKPWHGWISSAAFKVALKLLPDSKSFVEILTVKDQSYEAFKDDVHNFTTLLTLILQHIHSTLRFYDLDKLKCT